MIRVGRGRDRINPLDPGPLAHATRLPAEQARTVRAEIRGRQLTGVKALCALVRGTGGAPVSNGEEVLLSEALDQLPEPATRSRPCPRCCTRCASPPALIGAAEGRTRRDYDDATRELRRTTRGRLACHRAQVALGQLQLQRRKAPKRPARCDEVEVAPRSGEVGTVERVQQARLG